MDPISKIVSMYGSAATANVPALPYELARQESQKLDELNKLRNQANAAIRSINSLYKQLSVVLEEAQRFRDMVTSAQTDCEIALQIKDNHGHFIIGCKKCGDEVDPNDPCAELCEEHFADYESDMEFRERERV